MKGIAAAVVAALVLAGCGGGGSSDATAVPTPTVTLVVIASPGPTSEPTPVASPPVLTPTTLESTTATTTTTNGPSAVPGQHLVVSGTGKSGLKLRASPDGKVILLLTEGTVLTGLGDQQKSGQYTWVHVRTDKGVDGWVASSYVAAAAGTATAPPGGA